MIDAQLRPGRLQLPNIDMSDYVVHRDLTKTERQLHEHALELSSGRTFQPTTMASLGKG